MGCSPGSPPSSPASFPERRLRRDRAGLGRSLPPPPAPRHFANRKDHAMTEMIKNFWKDEEGATAIEYGRSEEHTSELQSPCNLVCRLLLEKKKKQNRRSRSVSLTP